MEPSKRIRGRKLQEIRKQHLAINPLCVMCKAKGKVRLATQLDHIVALDNGGGESEDPFHNRQGLCTPCHLIKTAQDFGHKIKHRIGPDGWPID
jgi:5-methylcytosine-specific restriction protein A